MSVYAVPAGADFTACLVEGLTERLAGLPQLERARAQVLLNTRRAQRTVEAALAADTRWTGLLPAIGTVTDLAEGDAVPPLRRMLHLARLVAAMVEADPGLAPRAAVFDLANSLAALIDEMDAVGLPPEALAKLDPAGHAEHWQRALAFLRIATEAWPEVRAEAEGGAPDPEALRRAAVRARLATWQAAPAPGPVILAGSTGSRAWVRLLMEGITALPQGAIVLPGWDSDLPADIWRDLDLPADHPQYGLAQVCRALRIDPVHLPLWHGTDGGARGRLVSLALRPAPTTDTWLAEAPARAPEVAEATADLTLIEAKTPREEAETIAWTLRRAVEAGETAALVTPDRDIARRVTAALDRWGIVPDDSAGRPLHLTPPGILLRQLAALIGRPVPPADLVALLKHPLVGGTGEERRLHLRRVIGLQTGERLLDGPAPDWAKLAGWAEDRRNDDGAPGWIAWLRGALAPLGTGGDDLADHIARLRQVAEALSGGEAGTPTVWDEEAGLAAQAVLDRLAQATDAAGPVRAQDVARLLDTQLAAENVRAEAFLAEPRIRILGALEARMVRADLTILAGLNEGVWPGRPAPDPWLSRDMRRAVGLELPERETGLAAHDIQSALSGGRVVMTRAARVEGAPTVASRWLIRLTNLIEGLGPEGAAAFADMRARGSRLLAEAVELDRPAQTMSPAPRPNPAPPPEARPRQLSVTRIETLIRDPYAIYARHVLGLKPLDPPGRAADALMRGTVLHAIMERFATALGGAEGAEARALLDRITEEVLTAEVPAPAIRALWRGRLLRIADVLVQREVDRRAAGVPVGLEVRGHRDLADPPFRLTAKADRIDRDAAGRYRIYDYKSGNPPSEKEVRSFAVQLPLEASIAQAGGFAGLDPAPVAHLELIGLGSDARTVPVDPHHEDIAQAWERLAALIAEYAQPGQGYIARSRPRLVKFASDYDHLARRGEWGDADAAPVQVVT
ncbi:double-strand break repair protein AddB [Pontivivens ytuae]|uniref:Double-strand break repair protein AddB n=1 Tax=Pontivivens ytuae TaxID=2789856 RepID=A0A7S9LP67_9RHOB|nr:double-strand break repair protein AddB [Pontivivens ytuae]QPH52757.1 double-strand break repair protein AddB [Pontivivens ytuae]